MLERKWPEKYNAGGHYSWGGHLYGNGVPQGLLHRWRVYYGRWGTGLFQAMYKSERPTLSSLALMPEWYLVIALLAALAALGSLWGPLLAVLPLAVAAAGLLIAQAVGEARRVSRAKPARRSRRMRSFLMTVFLHMLQPFARLSGRLRSGLTPWRARGHRNHALPRPASWTVWSQSWRSLESWICLFEKTLRKGGTVVIRGGNFDRWDLELRGGLLGRARILTAVEEHGHGSQLVRFRLRPLPARGALFCSALLAVVAIEAGFDGAPHVAAVLGLVLVLVLGVTASDCAYAAGSARRAVDSLNDAVLRTEQTAHEDAASADGSAIGARRPRNEPKVGRG
jgi:hypothetical protein